MWASRNTLITILLITHIIGISKNESPVLEQSSSFQNIDVGLRWCEFASEITVLKTIKMLIVELLEIYWVFLGLDPVDVTNVLSWLSLEVVKHLRMCL